MISLSACSFSIAKPPASYSQGVAPECSTPAAPLVLDAILIAGLSYLMFRPSSVEGIDLCTGPCKVAAALAILSVPSFALARGGTRLWRCRGLRQQHRGWLTREKETWRKPPEAGRNLARSRPATVMDPPLARPAAVRPIGGARLDMP